MKTKAMMQHPLDRIVSLRESPIGNATADQRALYWKQRAKSAEGKLAGINIAINA